ncbi:MAG: hypothetical protein NUW12_00095 [Firmicutes bacterium]|jgi:hypothetical protein|nr:hypothetical protein [Bacillota bacterium]MDH7494350.1 hypothetical protein [Bacillota bacterium]
MVLTVGSIRISVEIDNDREKAKGSRKECLREGVLREDHIDVVRSKVMRDTVFMRLR